MFLMKENIFNANMPGQWNSWRPVRSQLTCIREIMVVNLRHDKLTSILVEETEEEVL